MGKVRNPSKSKELDLSNNESEEGGKESKRGSTTAAVGTTVDAVAAVDDGGGTRRKKIKSGREAAYEAGMRKIAEIVLVLSAMGTMRGGREPTDVEKSMMSEARAKVASICEDLVPKDIMPREVFGGLIEDLGLNRFKEQHRFKPSIAQKMEISLRHVSAPAIPTGLLNSNLGRDSLAIARVERPHLRSKGRIKMDLLKPLKFQLDLC